eukprot:TRINITY_DN22_c1_g2_i2.p1 TRINITY_DN22_c1_g2~~TRINITY_DN22_c1_g2_i2.p1  ORF type:complete len:319 (+),score=130.59 TRINITY_DN22_c1_g2_i2:31-957(+)
MSGRAPRTRSLLIGINYFQQQGELRGCINDVKNLKSFLIESGFNSQPENMRVLTDDNKNQGMPIKKNVEAGMKWLVEDNQPGDLLFFHFSGHGSQAQDTTGDEADGTDETLVPLDYKTAGQIVDDDMHTMMVKPLKAGVRFYAVFDCCHSGTALDLPFVYCPSGAIQGGNTSKISKTMLFNGLLDAGKSLMRGDKLEAAKKVGGVLWEGYKLKKGTPQKCDTNSSPADIVMLSGCRDDQTSADATIGGEATGAMSYALMLELKADKNPTLLELLNGMRKILADAKFTQVPQMSTGHEMDPTLRFSLKL